MDGDLRLSQMQFVTPGRYFAPQLSVELHFRHCGKLPHRILCVKHT